MIQRRLEDTLKEKVFKGKAILVMGPRQVGKTTLLKELFLDNDEMIWLNGDELDIQNLFEGISADRFRAIIGKKKIVIIDEAQRIKDIVLRLKLITDTLPEVQLIATGSSSFELANSINEPLTGRKWLYNFTHFLFPKWSSITGCWKSGAYSRIGFYTVIIPKW